MIHCKKCGRDVPEKDWRKSSRMCKDCKSRANQRYYKRHAKFSRYGMTEAAYNRLYRKQEGKCAICKIEVDEPYIDHDHHTIKVRGLLCNECNVLLGFAKDRTWVLQNAIEYLNSDYFIP